MTGVTLPASTSSLRATRSSSVLGLDGRAGLLAHEHRHELVRIVRASLPPACPPPFEISIPLGRQGAPRLGHRVVAHVVEDEVVALAPRREVLAGVVDDVVGADGADQLHVPGAGHAGDLGTERLGDLHGERAHAARRPVDQDLLSGLDLAVVAKELEGGRGGDADGRRLLEREVGRLPDELVLGRPRVLGEGAGAPPEDLVARSESLHVLADRLDRPRDIRPGNGVLRLAQAGGHAHDERRAGHEDPVADVDRGRAGRGPAPRRRRSPACRCPAPRGRRPSRTGPERSPSSVALHFRYTCVQCTDAVVYGVH